MSITARSLLLLVALLGAVPPLAAATVADDCAGCCCGPQASAPCPCEAESGPTDPVPAPERDLAPDGPSVPALEPTAFTVVGDVAEIARVVLDADAPARPPARLIHCVRTL